MLGGKCLVAFVCSSLILPVKRGLITGVYLPVGGAPAVRKVDIRWLGWLSSAGLITRLYLPVGNLLFVELMSGGWSRSWRSRAPALPLWMTPDAAQPFFALELRPIRQSAASRCHRLGSPAARRLVWQKVLRATWAAALVL